jgi:CheY-like chemotaxis protein
MNRSECDTEKGISCPPSPRVFKIAIIDDNHDDIFFLWMAFNKFFQNCEVAHFDDGERALQELSKTPPDGTGQSDIIILDIKMSQLDGFDVLAKLKENTQTAQIPVIMLSGSSFEEDKIKAKRLGAIDFVIKTADCSGIVGKVRELKEALRN